MEPPLRQSLVWGTSLGSRRGGVRGATPASGGASRGRGLVRLPQGLAGEEPRSRVREMPACRHRGTLRRTDGVERATCQRCGGKRRRERDGGVTPQPVKLAHVAQVAHYMWSFCSCV